MLAIVEAIRMWRPYLFRRKFFVQTDQRSLKYFLDQCVATPEQQKWLAKLMGYDYEIIYRPDSENSVADALSHQPNSPVLHHLHTTAVTLWDEIKGRVVIPSCVTLWTKLLHEAHNTKIGGHSSVLRTFKQLAQKFYWPKMHQFVQAYIKHCEACQKMKSETLYPAGLLHPLPIPSQVSDDITLDFVEGLPTSHDKDTILVVVDSFTYHPQTDGQTEVVNQCVEKYLHCFVHQWSHKWSTYIPWAELWYNKTFHASTGMTPFQALYGCLPHLFHNYRSGDSSLHEEDVTFDVGEMEFLKLHPYRQQLIFKRAHQKLVGHFYEPYPIIQKIGMVAYKLQLSEGARIHPIFHVSLLKKIVGDLGGYSTELPPVNDEGIILLEPQ
ncbi:Transposon Ty3-G Gag-Pol polyprotein [Vitis vinifera]|uniref:Transposon Ty3-G Gag-Pol polyprotein n=1 Tax=Vitis vinifera TaxID=29760 RepID=A0A438IWY6_VITVI|nr:Transposon Ty3-G Gag-Pol polyprotein [Vitis vinifera]